MKKVLNRIPGIVSYWWSKCSSTGKGRNSTNPQMFVNLLPLSDRREKYPQHSYNKYASIYSEYREYFVLGVLRALQQYLWSKCCEYWSADGRNDGTLAVYEQNSTPRVQAAQNPQYKHPELFEYSRASTPKYCSIPSIPPPKILQQYVPGLLC